MIAELFRHGARETETNILKIPEIEDNLGQLTASGKREHYTLGKLIRKTYPDLFPEKFDHNKFQIVSSHMKRTVESGIAHAMGIYDIGSGEKLTTTDPKYINPPYAENFSAKLQDVSEMSTNTYVLPQGVRTVPIFALDALNDWTVGMYLEYDKKCPYGYSVQKKTIEKNSAAIASEARLTTVKLKAAGFEPMNLYNNEVFNL